MGQRQLEVSCGTVGVSSQTGRGKTGRTGTVGILWRLEAAEVRAGGLGDWTVMD